MRCGEMLKAYKYRLYPNKEQRIYLAKTFGCTRFVYNRMLADRIKSYDENKDLDIKAIKYPTPAQYKKEFLWLKEADSLALANAQMNLDKAYKNFLEISQLDFLNSRRKVILIAILPIIKMEQYILKIIILKVPKFKIY